MKRIFIALAALLLFAAPLGAFDQIKISELPTVTATTPSVDVIPGVFSNVTGKITINNLLGIGSVTQAYDADLATIAGLTPVSGKFIISSATPAWSASAYTLPLAIGTQGQGLIVNAGETGFEYFTPFDATAPGEIGGTTPGPATFTSLTVTGSTNDYKLGISNNSGGRDPTAGAWELYPDAGTWKMNTNGTEATIATTDTVPTLYSGTGAITVSAKNAYVVCTGACQLTLPTPAAGSQVCARNAPGSATVITLNNQTGVYYEKTDHSAYGTANYKFVSGGLATDSICIVGLDATHYLTLSSSGIWTDTAP